MKGLVPLFLGIFGTFAFSWVGLTVIPNWQIGHLNPQSDEEGTDIYPMPQSGMAERGAHIYAANGCIYCHSQQVRADYAAADIDRKWGDRRSAPRDYIFERPVSLGKMRMGQDLANVGARTPVEEQNVPPPGNATSSGSPAPQGGAPAPAAAPSGANPSPGLSPAKTGSPPPPVSPLPKATASPVPAGSSITSPAPTTSPAAPSPNAPSASPSPSAMANASSAASAPPGPALTSGESAMYSSAWHHLHLYSPRHINVDSNMPSYRFLYQTRRITDAPSTEALQLTGSDAPPEGWEIVPTFDAKCLVAYLMSLNQSHPLKEARSAAPAASPAPSPSPAPGK